MTEPVAAAAAQAEAGVESTAAAGAGGSGDAPARVPGIAPVKAAHLMSREEMAKQDEDRAAAARLLEEQGGHSAVEEKKKGKKRRRDRGPWKSKAERLCPNICSTNECKFAAEDCVYSHDVMAFIAARAPDLGDVCPIFHKFGYCRQGIKCRFGLSHTDAEGRNLRREEKDGGVIEDNGERNRLTGDMLHHLRRNEYPFLRSRKDGKSAGKELATITSERFGDAAALEAYRQEQQQTIERKRQERAAKRDAQAKADPAPAGGAAPELVPLAGEELPRASKPAVDPEVKVVDFRGKVYVAPLTTVGNLPFRRVMKHLGADITCGEMALSNSLLSGNKSEWSLVRRAPEEDIFGVQVAGCYGDQMARTAEVLRASCDVDFIDVNCGCPIDIVTSKGSGSALMTKPHRVAELVESMGEALWRPRPYAGSLASAADPLRPVPITVKMRTGWHKDSNCAHTVIRRVQSAAAKVSGGKFGPVAAVMVHGRTRTARYTGRADWDYVGTRAGADQDPNLPLLPVIGNGDLLSFTEWESRRALYAARREGLAEAERDGPYGAEEEGGRPAGGGIIDCAMLARGALIKPWLPTEIKERRHWDISSGERLELLRKFSNWGLEHWGSDEMGVEKTRRFLLEWLSFTCRYVPVGLLEVLPQHINDRPPRYYGRDDLETLLSSDQALDWVKITEMLLGPTPQGFRFQPRHKSNSYARG